MNIFEIKYHAEYLKTIKREYAEILQEISIGFPTYEVVSLLKRLELFWARCAKDKDRRGDKNFDLYSSGYKNLDLYYILMCIRSSHPDLFPSHDLCFFAAKELYEQIYPIGNDNVKPLKKSSTGDMDTSNNSCTIIFSIELLPILILINIVIPELTVYVELKHSNYMPYTSYTEEIIENLKGFMPNCKFELYESNEIYFPKEAWILFKNTQMNCEQNKNFIEEIQYIRGGIIFANWNFLGAKGRAFNRHYWVKSGFLKNISQLPRPKRQGVDAHPCLITLGNVDKNSNIKLTHIQGNLMEYIIQMSRPKQPKESESLSKSYTVDIVSVLVDVILHDSTCNLTPAYYLAKSKLSVLSKIENQVWLREVAHVLRYQGTRIRIDSSTDPVSGGYTYREITLKELDPLTGFINRYDGSSVICRHKIDSKYIIQPNDIVFAYRGSRNTIGKAGFADGTFNPFPKSNDTTNAHTTDFIQTPAITGSSLCIIRPFNIDPIWLFYFLQQKYVREILCSRASGSNLLAVNIEDVRDILVQIPDEVLISFVNTQFNNISKAMTAISGHKGMIVMALNFLYAIMNQENEKEHNTIEQ